MVGAIVIGAIVLAVIVGFWLTRKAKGPTTSEVTLKTAEAEARVGPTGEPMDWGEGNKPPPDY